jgi:CRISPR-associated endoribonuclease Cas6
MRLLIRLKAKNSERISFNYNYSLSAFIYKLLKLGSPEFAEFLHNQGFQIDGKSFKFFTFALKFESAVPYNGVLKLKSPNAFLIISSPLIDDFIKNFVIGTFENQAVELVAEGIRTEFRILTAEMLPEPEFMNEMNFIMHTPMILSKKVEDKAYYFRVDDNIEEANKIFCQNLISKYEALYNKKYVGEGIKLIWDYDYIINAAKRNLKLSKKVKIMKDLNNPIDLVGLFCPFSVKGDTELIKLGYRAGFGSQNSMGFGLVDLAK